jgi:hypothetical protein
LSLYVHPLEDLAFIDAFHVPPFLDSKVDRHKEWYHFVFYDAHCGLFGFLNFSLIGNPFSSRKGCYAALIYFVDLAGRWVGEFQVLDSKVLKISNICPRFIADSLGLFYDGNAFHLVGHLSQVEANFDLRLVPDAHPVSTRGPDLGVFGSTSDGRHELYPMRTIRKGVGEVAKGWVSVPRMKVTGGVTLGRRKLSVFNALGYHDHNWGQFEWGDPFGWDGGVALGGLLFGSEPLVVGFFFDRSAFAHKTREGGLFIRTRRNFRKVFSGKDLKFTEKGVFTGPTKRLPGYETVLHPDHIPSAPSSVIVSGNDGRDHVTVKYSLSSLCELVTAGRSTNYRTIWKESFGRSTIMGKIDGKRFSSNAGFWMESVRPHK